jgi:hypothetical protein
MKTGESHFPAKKILDTNHTNEHELETEDNERNEGGKAALEQVKL